MAVEGTLDLFKLPEILQLIAQQKKTGILTVQGPRDIVAISFLAGRIVAADALNQAMEEGLAKVLVDEGLIGAGEMARATADHQESGERLIDVLVDRGYVSRLRLLGALRLQTYRLVEQLLHWEEGDFKFYSGEEVSYEESFVPIPVEEILLHSVQDAEATKEAAAPPVPSPPAGPRPSRGPAATGPRLPAAPAAATEERERRQASIVPWPLVPPPPLSPPGLAAAEPGGRGERAGVVVPLPFRRMQVEESAVPRLHRRVGQVLAVLAAALVVAVVVRDPADLVLPFPWQDGQRSAFARAARAPLYLKIDRAAKTFFLLEGHFPDRLSQLQAAGLLAPADLFDPALGTPLRYSARAEGYKVQPVDSRGTPREGSESTEAITGNFLLDPEFVSVSPDSKAPLVLLD
ncbi:MAG TPA: DUF4388 domain-containing protein [Thermoanaerobaculia bacterium]|jgi:hypothetical protein